MPILSQCPLMSPDARTGFRTMKNGQSSLLTRITIDPEICHGKPVIRHLRYPVESMLEYLAAGDTFEDLLTEFPDLEREDL